MGAGVQELRDAFDSDDVPRKNIALRRASDRIAELEAVLSEIHASVRRMTFAHEWYLEGGRYSPGVYVLMRVGPVPEGYEPTF